MRARGWLDGRIRRWRPTLGNASGITDTARKHVRIAHARERGVLPTHSTPIFDAGGKLQHAVLQARAARLITSHRQPAGNRPVVCTFLEFVAGQDRDKVTSRRPRPVTKGG